MTRGSISKFFDAYVDLQTDLQIAKLRYTAAAHDRIVDRDGAIGVLVSARWKNLGLLGFEPRTKGL